MPMEIRHISAEIPDGWGTRLLEWGRFMDDYGGFDEPEAADWYRGPCGRALVVLAADAWQYSGLAICYLVPSFLEGIPDAPPEMIDGLLLTRVAKQFEECDLLAIYLPPRPMSREPAESAWQWDRITGSYDEHCRSEIIVIGNMVVGRD